MKTKVAITLLAAIMGVAAAPALAARQPKWAHHTERGRVHVGHVRQAPHAVRVLDCIPGQYAHIRISNGTKVSQRITTRVGAKLFRQEIPRRQRVEIYHTGDIGNCNKIVSTARRRVSRITYRWDIGGTSGLMRGCYVDWEDCGPILG